MVEAGNRDAADVVVVQRSVEKKKGKEKSKQKRYQWHGEEGGF